MNSEMIDTCAYALMDTASRDPEVKALVEGLTIDGIMDLATRIFERSVTGGAYDRVLAATVAMRLEGEEAKKRARGDFG